MIHLSDLHFGEAFFSFHRRLVNHINSLEPDLLIIPGDAVDEDAEKPTGLRQFLKLLQPGIRKIAVPGNHDHKSGVAFQELQKVYEQMDVRLLINETVKLYFPAGTLTVTGLDDMIEGNPCFIEATKHLGTSENHILLIHSPKHQESVLDDITELNRNRPAERHIRLQYIFAGHNHGGQIRLPTYVPVLPLESGNYIDGGYNEQPPYLYLSKVFGTSAVPFRWGARPEIAVFHYHID